MSFEHDVVSGFFECPHCLKEFESPSRRSLVLVDDWPIGLADTYRHTCIRSLPVHACVLSAFGDAYATLRQAIFEACPDLEEEEAA